MEQKRVKKIAILTQNRTLEHLWNLGTLFETRSTTAAAIEQAAAPAEGNIIPQKYRNVWRGRSLIVWIYIKSRLSVCWAYYFWFCLSSVTWTSQLYLISKLSKHWYDSMLYSIELRQIDNTHGVIHCMPALVFWFNCFYKVACSRTNL